MHSEAALPSGSSKKKKEKKTGSGSKAPRRREASPPPRAEADAADSAEASRSPKRAKKSPHGGGSRAAVKPVAIAASSSEGSAPASSPHRGSAEYWRAKFEELSAVRQTEAEAALEEALAHVRELETALRAADAAAGEPATAEAASSEEEEVVSELQRTIRAYRLLTGAQVSSVRETGDKLTFSCGVTSDLSSRHVDLGFAWDSGEGIVEYEPVSGLEVLPDYLRNEIEFDTEQCPVMMSRVLTIIHTPRLVPHRDRPPDAAAVDG